MTERKNLKARATLYNGIKMRSRTEALFAQALDKLGVHWEYESAAFASARGQYLPDFKIEQDGGDWSLYVEVKPFLEEGTDERYDPGEIFHRMRVIHNSDPNARLAIATPDLVPFVLMQWEEPWPLWHFQRDKPLEVDDGRSIIVEQVGLAAWFRWADDEAPVIMPLAGLPGDHFIATAVAEGAGPLPFDWKWKKG